MEADHGQMAGPERVEVVTRVTRWALTSSPGVAVVAMVLASKEGARADLERAAAGPV